MFDHNSLTTFISWVLSLSLAYASQDQILAFCTTEADQKEGTSRASSCGIGNVIRKHFWSLVLQVAANVLAAYKGSRAVTVGHLSDWQWIGLVVVAKG